jgi:hypothetical protein
MSNLADASLVDLYRFMVLELTEDQTKSHDAWRERRAPVFKGRWAMRYGIDGSHSHVISAFPYSR